MEHGLFKGEQCNRNGCAGIIDEHSTETSCSCHINPPCSHCTDSREYCPVCEWEGTDERALASKETPEIQKRNAEHYRRQSEEFEQRRNSFLRKFQGHESITELEIWPEMHTHFSMIKKGVFPKGTETRSSIEPKVKGTFGGRFTRFTDTTFEYIAYTD